VLCCSCWWHFRPKCEHRFFPWPGCYLRSTLFAGIFWTSPPLLAKSLQVGPGPETRQHQGRLIVSPPLQTSAPSENVTILNSFAATPPDPPRQPNLPVIQEIRTGSLFSVYSGIQGVIFGLSPWTSSPVHGTCGKLPCKVFPFFCPNCVNARSCSAVVPHLEVARWSPQRFRSPNRGRMTGSPSHRECPIVKPFFPTKFFASKTCPFWALLTYVFQGALLIAVSNPFLWAAFHSF